jgi:CMP-N-acetylneuraminic acid synthetase
LKKRKITALVPFKAHSERVPSKNFKDLGGKPLFLHILETLSRVEEIDMIRVNTDAQESELSVLKGLDKVVIVPRPHYLVGDFVSMNSIIDFEIEDSKGDVFLMTHTTNPLLTSETIREMLRIYFREEIVHDSLLSVDRLQGRFFYENKNPINHVGANLVRTQDMAPIFFENSACYIFSKSSFNSTKSRIGLKPYFYELSKLESIDIDTESDWVIAQSLLKRDI